MARIVFGYADQETEWNTSAHRCVYPARILAETGRHQCGLLHISHLSASPQKPEVKEAVDSADIIILERLLLKELWPFIESWKKQGKRVFATFDDNYALMPDSGGVAKNTWRGGKKARVGTNADGSDKLGAILGEFRQTLAMMDGALVPSHVLADDYKPFCENMIFCPNVPYKPLWENLKRRPMDNNWIIGWGGSTAHLESWRSSHLAQALGLICKKYPRVHFHIQSRDPSVLIMLDKANMQGRYTSSLWCPFEVWPSVVYRWDLGVAPLAGEYDRRRSAIKHWESGMAGIPFVGTNLEPYQDGGGGSILVNNRATDWFDAISRLIESREEYERLAREGREWAVSLYDNAASMYEVALGLK